MIKNAQADCIDHRAKQHKIAQKEPRSILQHDFSEEIDKDLEAIYSQSGGEEKVSEYLQNLKAEYPDNYSIHHKIGDFYFNLKQYAKAIKNYSRALERNPNAVWSYHNLSIIYAIFNQWPKSHELSEKVKTIQNNFWYLNQNNFLVQLHRANSLANKKNTSEALKVYQNAYLLNPDSVECFFCLIDLYLKQEQVIQLLFLLDKKQPSSQVVIDRSIKYWIQTQATEQKSTQKLLNKLHYLLLISPKNQSVHELIDSLKINSEQSVAQSKPGPNRIIKSHQNRLVSIEKFLHLMDTHLINLKIS